MRSLSWVWGIQVKHVIYDVLGDSNHLNATPQRVKRKLWEPHSTVCRTESPVDSILRSIPPTSKLLPIWHRRHDTPFWREFVPATKSSEEKILLCEIRSGST